MLKLIKKYLKGYGLIAVLAPSFKLFEAVIELFIPRLVAAIIDTGIKNGDLSYVWRTGGLILSLYFLGFVCAALCQYFSAKSAFGYGTNLRGALYRHINALPMAAIDRFQPSTLTVRLSLDVNNTQNAINRFMRLATRAPFILFGALIMAVDINARMSLIFFAAAFLIALALYFVMKNSAPKLLAINKQHDEITRLARENLAGTRVVRAFNKQADTEKTFNSAAEELKKESVRLDVISALTNPLTYLIVNIAIVFILYFGAFSVNAGSLTQGETVALINYMLQILNGLVLIAMMAVLFARAGASSKRINAVLDTPAEAKGGLTEIRECETALVFKNVSARYENHAQPSLRNISFTLKAGQTLGVVGGTASGKTTLAGLVARMFDYEGEIEFFGNDLRAYDADALRENIGFAAQAATLFSGTVRENIDMGRDMQDEHIFIALKAAKADFVKSLDDPVARGGSNFSGGQRQRLCIARALAAHPILLILDDASSALDYATEAAVRRELNKIKGMTKIIVTQRAASIKNADLIIVLDEGAAAGVGTHKELLGSCALYKEIVEIQEKI